MIMESPQADARCQNAAIAQSEVTDGMARDWGQRHGLDDFMTSALRNMIEDARTTVCSSPPEVSEELLDSIMEGLQLTDGYQFGDSGVEVRECVKHGIEIYRSSLMSHSTSAPKWSPTPPTKDGWYWMKEGVGSTEIVEVDGGVAYTMASDFFSVSTSGCLWYGPLQEPAE